MTERQPGPQRRGEGEGAQSSAEMTALGPLRVVGELVEAVLDRGAEFLQREPPAGARREAAVDRLGQLAGQVRAQPAQRPGAVADRPRSCRRVGAAVRVLAAPAL